MVLVIVFLLGEMLPQKHILRQGVSEEMLWRWQLSCYFVGRKKIM